MVGCPERGVKPTPKGPPALRAARHSAVSPGHGLGRNRARNFGTAPRARRVDWGELRVECRAAQPWALDDGLSDLDRAGLNEEQRHRG